MAISLPYKDSVCSGKQVLSESVTYKINIVKTTMLPEKVVQGDKKTNYTYDECGNISTVTLDGTVVTKYTYDKLNRLKREDNQKFGKSYFYSYDNNGNITAKEETNYKTGLHTQGTGTVKSYVYENGRLISFDGEACTYDALGNPTTYRDKELQWSYGRRLMKFDGNTFKYDTHGLRIGKNSITFVYDSQGRLLKQSNGLQFIYDNTGLLGFRRGTAAYIYRKDIQGNIIAILDSSGAVVVEYSYDAWGNHKVFDASGNEITSASHIGKINPFRYRGYYYDTETKLYYLQSRYYDPETGRFLNMDSLEYADPETINGLNLYAYCGNNPVMNVDPTGHAFLTMFLIGLIAGIVIGAAANGVEAYNNGARGWELAGAIATGALVGGAIGAALGAGAALIGAGATMIGGAALVGGGISGGAAVIGAGAVIFGGALVAGGVIGGLYLMSQWIPGTWPGDDPTVPPGDDFVWRGPGEVGSEFGEWYNPITHDQLHPNLKHPLPKGPHWGWQRFRRFIKDIFK